MRKLLSFIFLFLLSICFAQESKKINPNEGFTIEITTDSNKNFGLYLKSFKGTEKSTKTIDFASIADTNKSVYFKRAKGISTFPVQISTENKDKSLMLFLKNGDRLKLNLNAENFFQSTINNELNTDFIAYQNENDLEKQKLLAQKILSTYTDDHIKIYFNFELVRLNALPRSKVNPAIKTLDPSINYENNIISFLPNTYAFLKAYFDNAKNYETAVEFFLKEKNCKSDAYKFYADWMVKNLEYRNSRGEDVKSKYEYLEQNYFNKEDCKQNLMSEITTINQNLKKDSKIILGKPLPNFLMKSIEGNEYNLKEYLEENRNPTIILYYSYSCSHCIADTPANSKLIEEYEKNNNVKFNKIAILSYGTEDEWQNFIKNSHLENWLNVTSVVNENRIAETLKIGTVPKFFILDKDGNLIIEKFNEDILINFLGRN